jgi:hypothetical protein
MVIILTSSFVILSQTCAAAPTDPSKIKIYVGPSKVPADSREYNCVFVQLLDSNGNPARAIQYTSISLSSSKTSIGTIDNYVTIPPGDTYGVAKFQSTDTAGTTTITGAISGFTTVQATITTTTVGSTPTKLAVFCSPSALPADNESYQAVQVQLQDSQGRPTVSSEDVQIDIFSSSPSVGTVNEILTIPANQTQITTALKLTNAPGSTTISAQAANFILGQAKVTTYFIDLSTLKVALTLNPQSVLNGNKTIITSYVTADGNPITGSTLKFTSSNGGTFSSTTDQGQGYYKTTFTAPSFSKTTNCTITASVSKTSFKSSQSTAQLTVGLIANNGSGTLQFLIKDGNGNPLSDTIVSSTAQPQNVYPLVDATNKTGYVTFNNLTAGTYSFKIFKYGYPQLNQTINFSGKTMPTLTFTLSNGAVDNTTLIITVSIVAVATAIAVISGLLIIRRKKSAKIRKLRDLQKQLKYKY